MPGFIFYIKEPMAIGLLQFLIICPKYNAEQTLVENDLLRN